MCDRWPAKSLEVVILSFHFACFFWDKTAAPRMLRLALNFARSLQPPLRQRLDTSTIWRDDRRDDERRHPLLFWAAAGGEGEPWNSWDEEEEIVPAVFQILMETGTRDLPSQEFGRALKKAFFVRSASAAECLLNEPKTFEAVSGYELLSLATCELLTLLPRTPKTSARYMRWIQVYRRCVDRALASGDVTWNYEPPIISEFDYAIDCDHLLIQCTRDGLSDMVIALLQHLPMVDIEVRSKADNRTALEIAASRISNAAANYYDLKQCYHCLYAATKWMQGYNRDVIDLLHSWDALSRIPSALLALIGTYVAAPLPRPRPDWFRHPTRNQAVVTRSHSPVRTH